jgi:tetratricopeptide (TPR) repeat protein
MIAAAAPRVQPPILRAAPAAKRAPFWKKDVQGIKVMKVSGSFRDMGFQHGKLLKEEIPQGAIPYYRTYLEKMVKTSRLGQLSPLIWPAVQKLIGPQVARGIPDFALECIEGLAEGAEVDLQMMMDGYTMPDSLNWVSSRFSRLRGVGPAVHHRLALGLGCTSAIAWGGATQDGKLLHARNFDFHGVASWPATHAVIFHEPDQGQRYVSNAAAGIPLGGVTAMNEAGLTLTVHQHMMANNVQLGGMPIGLIGDVVMRDAENLDDAEAILRSQRSIGGWTYLIADGKSREVLCFEENPDRQVARRIGSEEETFGYANIYLDQDLGETEMDLYRSYWRHNLARHQRAKGLLQEGYGNLDPNGMAAILGDTGSDDCRIAHAISMLMTVGSTVFSPEDGTLWVAKGEAPTSQNTYIPFSLKEEDHAPLLGELDGGSDSDPKRQAAFQRYRDAYLAYLDHENLVESLRILEDVCRQAPTEPLYHFARGVVALQQGRFHRAADALSAAVDLGHPDEERKATFHLWRGRSWDLCGERKKAERDYRLSLGHRSDPAVHRAAKKGMRKPFKKSQAKYVHLDFAFSDVVAP